LSSGSERGFDELIKVFGADHGGYVKRMKAAVSALTEGKVPLDIKLTQLVRLFKNGEPFKMSKRAGTFISLRDVVDQVGPDVTRFVMLTRKNDAPLDFDFDKVTEQSKDNAVFYVQYAHARIRSVIRKTEELGLPISDHPKLEDEAEFNVARKIAEWPRLIEIAARNHEPHRVAFYLYDLASEFHTLWNKGNEKPELRFVHEGDPEATSAKIALPRAVGVVISAGLGILGVNPVEEMR
jgi:arginyl-tRNA synthetase